MSCLIFFLIYLLISSVSYVLFSIDNHNSKGIITSSIVSLLLTITIIFLSRLSNSNWFQDKYNVGHKYPAYRKIRKKIKNEPPKYRDYNHYLKSKEWKQLRDAALFKANYKCETCGREAQAVHHIMYPKSLEDDSIENLLVVCNNCHEVIHSELKYPKFL